MTNEEWLKTLKIGDEVAIYIGKYGKILWIIEKIEYITATGKFRMTDKTLYDSKGVNRLDKWHSKFMSPVTEEIKKNITRRKLLFKIKKINFDNIPIEDLKKIVQFVTVNNK